MVRISGIFLFMMLLVSCALPNALGEYPAAAKYCTAEGASFAIDARLSAPGERPAGAHAMISCWGYNDLGYRRHRLVWLDHYGAVLKVDQDTPIRDSLQRIERRR